MMKHPDNCKTTYTMLKPETKTAPTIIFSTTALKWIKALVEVHNEEVGWLGIVDERPNNTYFIRDIFYPKHEEANGGTCEISTEGESLMANWLIDHNRIDDCSKVRFWGHSHHNMGVSPSSQDESQSIEKIKHRKTNFIRAICNKKGEMSVSFYDYSNQIRFDQIRWLSEDDTPSSVMDEKASKIFEILSDISTKRKDQFFEIIKLINCEDVLYEDIKKKVEDLKKTNIPDKKSYHAGSSFPDYGNANFYDDRFSRRSGSFAPDYGNFQKQGKAKGKGKKDGKHQNQTSLFYGDECLDDFSGSIFEGGHGVTTIPPIIPILDDDEVNAMVKEWENMSD